ncbi:MAG: zinc-ribbon domain-containing protein [Methanobrevibacter sp.]|nr:zinc-ribbon domain-containing protein [Methanobrevibacter sp.]
MTKHCLNCGQENEDDSIFCMTCGKRLSGLHTINTHEDNHTNNDKNKEMILIGLVAVLVIAIAIVGVFAFMSLNNNENNDFFNDDTDNNVNTVSSSSIPLSEVYGLAQALNDEIQTKDIGEIATVNYKGVTFTKQQCLYIFAKAIDMKNKGLDGNINFKSYGPPDDPLYGVSTYYLTKSEYVDMAQRTISWMDNNGKAPNYTGIVVAGSPDFGYDGLVLAFAMVIIASENGSLPSSISW